MVDKGQIIVEAELVRDDCLITKKLSGVKCSIQRMALRPEFTLHKIQSNGENCDVLSTLRSDGFKVKATHDGEVWVESRSCSVCSFLSKLPFVYIVGTSSVTDDKLLVRFILPSLAYLRQLKTELLGAGIDYRITSINPYAHQKLTAREDQILEEAMNVGYFESENRVSLTDFAHILGIAPSSLSELIRRSVKKTVQFYLDRRK